MSFFSPYRYEFLRIAACVPRIGVGDPAFNVAQTLDLVRGGDAQKIAIMIFPELGISAYAIDDLLFQDALLDRVEAAIADVVAASRDLFPIIVVGAPLRRRGQLFNCAVVIYRGAMLGVVPKTYLPNYREFYEVRQCTSGSGIRGAEIEVAGRSVPFGVDLLFQSHGSVPFAAHVEICEDVWVPQPPSTAAASEQTKANARLLMAALGATAREIDIRPVARQMLADLGHPFARGENVYDVTFENVQAGLRTDYLFRLANYNGALVCGTGDLSELALGWCTYGVGDQMSHYNVNASVSKTLIKHLIKFVATSGDVDGETAKTLFKILATDISPELVPVDASGIMQSTEKIIGPYDLQDFNLYYVTRYGFRPSKICYLAHHAWSNVTQGNWPNNIPAEGRCAYALSEIKHWLEVFLFRFFTISQFKRSALPNGPKISSGGSLSPRGDWRAPSDGDAQVWLDELRANVP